MERTVEVLPDVGAIVERAKALVVEQLTTAIATRGQATIALAGGSTPKPLYEAIAQCDLPWEKLHIFWGDERYVPPDHPDSNEGMARRAWLDHVPIPAEHIHAMPTDATDPAIAADRYEQTLLSFFQPVAGEIPTLDVVLLGMGDDGHTASLFPHTAALNVRDRLITVGNKDGQPRLSFTVPLINQARCVVFLVAGANKQVALRQVFAPDGDELTYPSRLICPAGDLWWLLDDAAGQAIAV